MKYLLPVVCGLVLALVFLEFALRVYLEKTKVIEPLACRREDPILHHTYKPGGICRYKTKEWDTQITVNELGLRNREVGTKQKFRIIVLGDSFTAAESVAVEKTAASLLEEKLNERGKSVEVINAGVPSYSPILEYLWLREYGLSLEPDLVVLNFDMGDVSGENFMTSYYKGDSSTLDEHFSFKVAGVVDSVWGDTRWQMKETRGVKPLSAPVKVKFWLHSHFKTYNFLTESLKRLARNIRGEKEPPVYALGDVKNDFEYVTRSEDNAGQLEVYKVPITNIVRSKNLVEGKGIPFVVIYFPHGHQVSAKEWASGREFYALEQDKLYSRKAIDVLMNLSKSERMIAYDVSEYFVNAQSWGFPLFWPFDGHFTENGNLVMAEALSEVLADHVKQVGEKPSQ